MSERSRMLGERVDLRQRIQRLAVRCDALKDSLRELCSPIKDALELDADKILDTAAGLHAELCDMQALQAKLNVLNREIGN